LKEIQLHSIFPIMLPFLIAIKLE